MWLCLILLLSIILKFLTCEKWKIAWWLFFKMLTDQLSAQFLFKHNNFSCVIAMLENGLSILIICFVWDLDDKEGIIKKWWLIYLFLYLWNIAAPFENSVMQFDIFWLKNQEISFHVTRFQGQKNPITHVNNKTVM